MNTGIAQLVALAAHGNAVLHNLLDAGDLNASPLFRHVSTLSFALEPDRDGPSTDDVPAWFESFRARGITRFRFIRLSGEDGPLKGYDLTAFANGEQSAVAAIDGQDAMELWAPDWQRVESEEGWRLTYRGHRMGEWQSPWDGEPVSHAAQRLGQVLREIADFARNQGLENWVENFEGARAQLAEPRPSVMGLLPAAGYGREARQLLAAALSSWVFGGMGSWNDTGPRDSSQFLRYDELTGQLYDALMNGLVSATNAFDPGIRPAEIG